MRFAPACGPRRRGTDVARLTTHRTRRTMERRDDLPERLPLPSEDEGDLIDEPATGESDDPLIASQEGVPWVPPSDRVLRSPTSSEEGGDLAGAPASDKEELDQGVVALTRGGFVDQITLVF